MKKKFLSLIALVALAVGITVAVNYVPSNGLKLLGKAEKAEFAGVGSGFASLATDPMTLMKAPAEMKASAALPKTADEGWSEWEEFAPGGSNDAVWTLKAWQTGTLNVKTYVRTSTTDATKKQIKCAGWGAGFFTEAGVDILLDWNTTTNAIEIPMQSTGYYVSNYKDYAVLGTFETGKYDPEQGKFSFYVGYSVPQYYVMGQGFGFGDETLQMAGAFKDYSISFSRGTVDDAATPIKQTVNVVPGKDITSYRVHVDTYENYAAAQGSAAYFEALAKAEGTDYTTPSATVELQGSAYNIYVVVVSAFANGEMKKYDYGVYEVSPASDWETIGTRPYREDIVTSLYNFQVTGPVYDVEMQKHKTYKDIYRIKNPYGSTSPFKSYTLYENAYLYLNAQDSAKVTPTFQLSKCDLGIDIEGGMPLDVYLADKTVGGTFDGYAITFPTKALVSTNYYVNTNGLFRAVINFRDAEFAFADDAKSIYTGETVKITSNNTLSTPTFESLTPEIATVDAKGVVTGVAPGVAKIKVVQDAILEFNAKEAVMEINVEKNPNSYASFVFNTDEGLAALGVEKPAASAATNLTGMTLTIGDVSMTSTDGGTATRVWNTSGATDLRMYKNGGSFTFSVPEGYKIISMDFTGAECSLFGEESEFETCTKSHTVWNAPEGESITSKTFAAAGTCKINVIKVKYLAPQSATVYYSQDYENGATSDWSTQVGGRFDPEIGEDASGNHYLRAAAGTRSSNGTGMYSNAYNEKLAAGTPFTMTADIHLRSTAGGNSQNGVEFTVGAAGASYNFSKWVLTGTMTLNMKQVAEAGTEQWILNGDTDHPITLPGTAGLAGTDAAVIYDEAPWYSIMLSWKDGLTFFSIKDKATGEVIVDKQQLKSNDSYASVGGVGQLWFSTSRYNAAFAIDNVVIRDIIDGDLPVIVPTTYTLNYVHEGDGVVLKDPVVLNTTVGTEVTASSADMASFFNADKSMKYIYKEGNTTIVASEDSAANVITLVYRDAAMMKYTVKSTGLPEGYEFDFTPYANPGDKFAEQWEGELVSVAYPQFVLVGDSLWTCPAGKYVAKTFNKEFVITGATKETVEYTDNYTIMNVTAGSKFNKLKDIVYYKEGEEIWPGECLAPNQYVRCSFGKAGAPALNEMAEIVTLPAGTYRVGMQFAQATTAAQAETFDLFLGEDTLFKAAIYGYVQPYQSPEFTITEDTKLYLKGLTVDGGGLDWIYVQKVVREEATIEFAGASTIMHVGDENALTFETTAPSGAAITYTSSNPEVGIVSEDGTFTAISAGMTVITATVAATDYTYSTSTQFVIKVREVPVPVTTVREWDFSKIATAYPDDYAAMKANEEYWEGTGDYRMFLKKAVLNEELTSNGTHKLSFAEGIVWTADAWKILVGDGSENYQYIQIQKGAEFYIPNVGVNDTIKFVGYAPSTSGSLKFNNCEPAAIDFHWGNIYEPYQVVVTVVGEFDFKAPQDFRLKSIVVIPEGQVYISSYESTGINDISAKNAQFFGEGTYDLSGRKVMNPVKGNVYIVNGKKYLCK